MPLPKPVTGEQLAAWKQIVAQGSGFGPDAAGEDRFDSLNLRSDQIIERDGQVQTSTLGSGQ